MSSNLENIKIKCERSPRTHRSIHIIFFSSSQGSSLCFFSFKCLKIQFEIQNETSVGFFFISKLSRWLRYSIKIFSAEFMRYYQQCTTGTSLLCSIYVFILHTGRPTKSKTCLTKLECLLLASVRERKKGHFLKNSYIHTKPPAAFG